MELIWVAWFFGGLIMGIVCCHLAYKGTENEDNQRKDQE